MKAYQFINYNNLTNVEHIKKYAERQAVLCFDFEDSIKTSDKGYYRSCFKNIITDIIPEIPSIKIGLRINGEASEFNKDLEAISNKFINTILLPKIESGEEIEKIGNLLAAKNITYDELIPIIESKKAMTNIEAIVDLLPPKIERLGFGHCDYNLDINAFPFFHQNSIEYWKWIKKIFSAAAPKNLNILNSPYLELENYSFFGSMLHNLYNIFGPGAGQTALNKRQCELINHFDPAGDHIPFNKLIRHRLDLRVPDNYEKRIVENYGKNKKTKTFSISGENSILISPHEFTAAKNYSVAKKTKSINMTFVGGCFPVQNDILFEDLFHQKLKRRIESEYDFDLNINIIRYELFNNCLNKIKTYHQSDTVDILVFHIRPEPFLRLVKVFYRYLNNNGELKSSLNFNSLKMSNSEKYDSSKFEKGIVYNESKEETGFRKLLIDLNYFIGRYSGNLKYAFEKYYELTLDIAAYCKRTDIKLLVLGIGFRNNTPYAKKLCGLLNDYLQNMFAIRGIAYLENLSIHSRNTRQYFQNDGIHASEKYHDLIAEVLFNRLTNLLAEKPETCAAEKNN